MKIRIDQVAQLPPSRRAIVHSHDMAIYSVSFEHENGTDHLVDEKGNLLTRHSLMEIKTLLASVAVNELVLRQQSAYDEMIGQPAKEGENTLEIPLHCTLYPPIDDQE